MIFISLCKKEFSLAGTRATATTNADKIKIDIVTDALRIHYTVPIRKFFFFFLCGVNVNCAHVFRILSQLFIRFTQNDVNNIMIIK